MATVLTGGLIVTPDGIVNGNLRIDGQYIASVDTDSHVAVSDSVVDVRGAYILPGVIDSHVHFREPGMTHKATVFSESRAAAAGGVTTVIDMPNCIPPTTSVAALLGKQQVAQRDSVVNMLFFIGAAHDNLDELRRAADDYVSSAPSLPLAGIKVFMGSSTGGMLLDDAGALRRVFSLCSDIPVVTHCENTDIINRLAQEYGDSTDMRLHSLIRSREACIGSSRLAIALAQECATRLHIAHVSTHEEIAMIAAAGPRITGEACVPHILFSDADYDRLATRIKCNPSIKTDHDRASIRRALIDGTLSTIATDHAPHLLSEKMQGGCLSAPSGMPMVQFSLPAMLQVFSPLTVARLMCENPARLFRIHRRGAIREGWYADLAIVRRVPPYVVRDSDVLSLCRWTPLAGSTLSYRVESAMVNGSFV